MSMDPHIVTVGDAARIAGLSTQQLRNLDDELQPIRLPNGQRRYRADVIAAFVEKRAARTP